MDNKANLNYMYKYHKYKTKYLDLINHQHGGAVKKNKHNKDKILGSLYGSCVGDALGSRYEFLDSFKATELIEDDMSNKDHLSMLGGGPFNTKVGQISDDSEMMLSLLKSIFYKKTYNQEDVAQQYINWFKSGPIDIGKTIKKSLFTRSGSTSNKDMISNSKELNSTSLSNGVLMRVTPIGVLGLKIKDKPLRRVVNQECDLTHPNKIVKDAVYMYVLAIKYTLQGMSKKDVYDLLLRKTTEPRVKIIIKDSLEASGPSYMIEKLDKDRYVWPDNRWYQGYFGIALQLALYELFNGSSFEASMISIIKKGGDVDTNCAIAGGLLGAHYGLSGINSDWVDSIKNSNNDRVKKYPYLSPKVITEYVNQMFKI